MDKPTTTPDPNTPAGTAAADAHDDLVLEHLDLVQHVVNQVSTRYPRHVDRSELWNAGALGLVDAARRYDAEMGIPFSRYAMIRIRGAIIDSTRSRDWSTRSLRRNLRRVAQATEEFEQEHARTPSSDELAETLGVDRTTLERYRAGSASATLLHLDQQVGESEDGPALGDLIEEDDTPSLPADQLEHRELVGTLRASVAHLPEVQREVVERYYFGGEYLQEIADSLGVTEARISQIRSEALVALRAYFADDFDGVEPVAENAPGRRARAAFLSAMGEHTTWRSRLDAADSQPTRT